MVKHLKSVCRCTRGGFAQAAKLVVQTGSSTTHTRVRRKSGRKPFATVFSEMLAAARWCFGLAHHATEVSHLALRFSVCPQTHVPRRARLCGCGIDRERWILELWTKTGFQRRRRQTSLSLCCESVFPLADKILLLDSDGSESRTGRLRRSPPHMLEWPHP